MKLKVNQGFSKTNAPTPYIAGSQNPARPELPTVDILLGVVAFVGLLAARRFLLPSLAGEPKQEGGAKSE